MPADKDKRDYEIGRGRPPKHTRFKPGQSGNPKGRPPRQRNMRTVLAEALGEPVTIREGERTRRLPRLDAMVRVFVNKALSGDPKAMATVVQMLRSAGMLDEEPQAVSAVTVTADDEAIIAEFLARQAEALEQPTRTSTSETEQTGRGDGSADDGGRDDG